MMKNGILTFIFAFCPGAGQMYQGYMKRGLSLITMFCLFVVIGVSTLEVLTVGCVIVWMYSFFDTFNLRAQIGAGTAPEDDYLVHINWKDQRMQEFMMDSHKLLGWGLIVLGALVAYQNILMNTLGDIPDHLRCVAGARPQGQKAEAEGRGRRFYRVCRAGNTGRAGEKGLCNAQALGPAGQACDPGGRDGGRDGGRGWTRRMRPALLPRKCPGNSRRCAGWAALRWVYA